MPEYLIIGGKNSDQALAAMAVAADINATGDDVIVDIIVPADAADIVRLSEVPRRVIAANVAPTPPSGFSPEIPSGGWRGVLSAAQTAAKSAADAAAKNFSQYRELTDEIRMVRYTMAFDIVADPSALLMARMASTEKIIGFAPGVIPNAAPGSALMYHEPRTVPSSLSYREKCRRLVAQQLNFSLTPVPEWRFRTFTPPAWSPSSPFILIGGRIPAPFSEVLADAGMPVVETPSDATVEEIFAAATAASSVAGSGLTTDLAAAAGARTFFIGSEKHCPPEATLTESPAALREALVAAPPVESTSFVEETPPVDATPSPSVEEAPSLVENETPPPAEPKKSDTDSSPSKTPPASGGLRIKLD